MRNFFKKVICIALALAFTSVLFSGCSSDKLLKKVAKDLNTYNINLKINDHDMTATGYEKFEYINRTDSAVDTLVFHLYPRAFREGATIKPYSNLVEARCFPNGVSYGDMKINEVKLNGEKIDIVICGNDQDKLQVNLIKPLYMDDSATIEIFFDLIIPNCTHRFGYYESNINLGNFYPVLAVRENGEYDLTPYYANGDPFYSDCANYNVEIQISNDYSVFATGDQVSLTMQENTKTIGFNALAVRDFALVLGTNFEVSKVENKNLTINYVGYKGDSSLKEMADLSCEAMNFFSEKFTNYPYKSINIVKTPFVHGGMEYPGLVMISDTIDNREENLKVIVHEIAHQWWYSLVGTNESKYAWIDEGLAEYSTALFFESYNKYDITYKEMVNDAITSYTLYVDVISALNKSLNTRMDLPVNEYLNEYEYTYMIYIKGLLLFDDLSLVVGESKLINALSKIVNEYRFQNIDSDIFTECIKKYVKVDTDNFFNSYLSGNVVIGKLH